MNAEDSMNLIFELAKNGDIKVYDMLSRESKIELEQYSTSEIVESIKNFFHDKQLAVGNSTQDELKYNFKLINVKRAYDEYEVILVKEKEDYKLLWNKKCLLDNI